MDFFLTPSSELDAVNVALATIGETPINDIDGDNGVDAAMARSMLHGVSREIQTKGYWFNTDDSYEFVMNAEGRVQYPDNLLSVRPIVGGVKLVRREGFFYDRTDKTSVFTEAPVADAVWFLAFDDLPESARRYVAIRSARVFQTQVLGSDSQDVYSAEQENEARAIFLSEADDNTYSEGYSYLQSGTETTDIWDK